MDMIESGIPTAPDEAAERQLRIDLAAAFRLAVFFDWHESVGNHFSAALGDDGKQFLLNPKWQHFSTIRASDLLRLNADDDTTLIRADAPDASAWFIQTRTAPSHATSSGEIRAWLPPSTCHRAGLRRHAHRPPSAPSEHSRQSSWSAHRPVCRCRHRPAP